MTEMELDSLLCELLHTSDAALCVLDTSGFEFEIRNEEELVRRIFDDHIFDVLQSKCWQIIPFPVKYPSLRQPAA